uniref:Uncharacterized protein n=1 Tax=Arundo donax TaxID=35708 RepID=A0A0A9EBB8_ARUDO
MTEKTKGLVANTKHSESYIAVTSKQILKFVPQSHLHSNFFCKIRNNHTKGLFHGGAAN